MIFRRGNPFDSIAIFRAAAASGRVDVIEALLLKGNSENISEALTLTITCGNTSIVRVLLERGESDDPEFCLTRAALLGNPGAMEQLLNRWQV